MKDHINGFDYLRALLSLFVVAWHLRIAGTSSLFDDTSTEAFRFGWSDFLNLQIFSIAVPAFILLSCFLYAKHGGGFDRLKSRVLRLSILAVFWSSALVVWRSSFTGLEAYRPQRIGGFVISVLQGADTPFYFFTSLIIALVVSQCALFLPRKCLVLIFFLFLFFVGCLPWLTISRGQFIYSAYWNPVNFLPLPFAGVLLAKAKISSKQLQWLLLPILLLLTCLAAVLEWKYYVSSLFFPGQGIAFPQYSRVSVVLSAIIIVLVSGAVTRYPPSLIRAMSRYSLALYCIHPFLLYFVNPAKTLTLAGWLPSWLSRGLLFLAIVLMSYFTAWVLRFALRKEMLF